VLQELCGAPVNRRRFLKGSLSGLALLGVGSLIPAGCKTYPKPGVPLQFFDGREYAIMNAVAARLIGAPQRVGSGADHVDVAARVDGIVATWDAESRAQLRTMLRVFEHGTYLFDLQRKRFTRLAVTAQDEYLGGWMNSTLGARRIVFRALKALATTGFYSDPRAWRRLGYDGPWLGRVAATVRVDPEPLAPITALSSRPA